MKTLLGSLALLGGLALALPAPAADEEKAGPKDNTPPPGFTALFNGKDLKGWQSVIPLPERAKLLKKGRDALDARIKADNEKYLKHWTVKHGVLVFDGKRGGRSLQTVKDYSNFELYVDWKIPPKGDSGIYLRGNPQVQIWDSDTLPDSLKRDRGKGSGGLWNNQKHPNQPLKKADKPVGQWNTFRILMKGDKVTVYLNGVKVVDDTPLENFWQRGKPLPATGPIELQEHGNTLWFKNIYIKEMD
jgi:hypothetical protein